MATGTITKVSNDSGTGYCKMADGTMLQWGTLSLTSGTMSQYGALYGVAASIVFPIAFNDANIVVTGSSKYGNQPEMSFGMTNSITASQAAVRLWDVASRAISSTNPFVVKWQAVGRWK